MYIQVQGTRVFANTGGCEFDLSKPVILLVHGAGMTQAVWGAQSRYLAHHGFSVLAVDLPGHGRSGGEPITSIEGISGFLIELIDACNVENVVVVGHSMGALACLHLAARQEKRVKGAVLCGAAAAMPVHPDLLAAAAGNDIRSAQLIASWGHGGRAHKGGNQAHGIWMIGTAVKLIRQAKPGVLATDLQACHAYEGAVEAANRVTCPVLLIQGAVDKMAPPKAAIPLTEKLAHCQQTVLMRCGHMMMSEAPDKTRMAIYNFARGLKP